VPEAVQDADDAGNDVRQVRPQALTGLGTNTHLERARADES
jgi:hypothetical protein